MTQRALIFAGAGASFAVNKEAYPTTVQFYERLPAKLREHKLVQAVVDNLPSKFGDGRPDVEKILWCLSELVDFLKKLDEPAHPAAWFISTNNLPGLVGGHDISSFAPTGRHARAIAEEVSGKISSKVYDYYSAVPSESELLSNWLSLFNLLKAREYTPT